MAMRGNRDFRRGCAVWDELCNVSVITDAAGKEGAEYQPEREQTTVFERAMRSVTFTLALVDLVHVLDVMF